MNKQFRDVLKSKRFITMIVALAVMLLVTAVPTLASAEEQIIESVTYIAMLLIAGYSVQDVVIAWLARDNNVDVFINAVQAAVDRAEAVLKVDIPDGLEAEAIAELRRRVQAVVDSYAARAKG